MKKSLIERLTFAKVTAVLAVSLGIGFGLCGLGMVVSNGGERSGFTGKLFTGIWLLGMAGFWTSGLGLIVTFLAWIIVSIIRSFTDNKNGMPD